MNTYQLGMHVQSKAAEYAREPKDALFSDAGFYNNLLSLGMRIVRNLGVPECDREDIVSEAVLKTWLAYGTDTRSVGALFRTIITHTALDYHRREHHELYTNTTNEYSTAGHFLAAPENPESQINSRLFADRLLSRLGEDDMNMLLMRAEDLTYEEIAAEMGIKESTAKARFYRVRQRARSLL